MLYTIKDDIRLCRELSISLKQLSFIKLLIRDLSLSVADARKASYKLALEFQHELGGMTKEELQDLSKREIVTNHNDRGKSDYDYFEINPKYLNKFTLKVMGMPRDLMNAYPDFFFDAQGKRYVAKGCTEAEIAEDYLRAINNNEEDHQRVIADVKWAIENGAIVMGLKKFVGARYWLSVRALKNVVQPKGSVNGTIV